MSTIHRPFRDPTPAAVREFIEQIPLYRDDRDDPSFWPAEQLIARRNTLLQRQLSWIAEASPFYRERFEREGIDLTAIATVDDLVRLPITTKAELMADPTAFRLRFARPTIYDTTYTTVYTTGTTTGRPTPYEYTSHDVFGIIECGRRLCKTTYLAPGDVYLGGFPLSPLPHVAGFGYMMTNAGGAAFVHSFTGTPYADFPIHRAASELPERIEQLRPQAMTGIGSFLRRMVADAARHGRDFSSLRLVMASGEVFTERMRAQLHESFAACGATEIFIASTYGFTEGGLAWAPCCEGGALHACAPDQIFLEILDPDTYQRLPDGTPGLVAITHLNRRGMPLLRYVLGDIAALSHAQCATCGRYGESLLVSAGSAHITRNSELLKIKGTLVNPQILHEVVMNTAGVIEYQILVTKQEPDDVLSTDRLLVRLGLDPALDLERWQADEGRELAERVFNATELRPAIEFVDDLSKIYDPIREFKARRVIDQRPPVA